MNSETIVNSGPQSLQRSTTLRIYNYYRIILAFLFLFLFTDVNFREFVGTSNPELFRRTILAYLAINILIGLSGFFINQSTMSKTAPAMVILLGDIVGLSLLMSASGGVASGLGNFLIFTVAFGGGLVYGRISTLLPAFALILTLYTELYLFFLGLNEPQSFFQAGVLGIVYFVANIFFQSLAQQLIKRESEVFSLEQINQLIVNKMRIGVVIATEDGDIKMINAAGKQLLYPGKETRFNEALPDVLLQKMRQIRANKQDHIEQSSFGLSTTFRPEIGGTLVSANFSSIDTYNGETLIFLEDNTELQRQAQQLKLASLGRLSASIAHEIRNPLGAISHAAQLLAESEALNSGDKRLSEIVQAHCLRLNGIIENVLQMSRRRKAAPQQLNIQISLTAFVEEFTLSQQEPIEITITASGKITKETLNITFDENHLSQVLGNLCENGLRYSKKHTNRAKVILSFGIDTSSDMGFIRVIDFGFGIDESLISNLFEPFYTTETSGTGLGLYLSRELCITNNTHLSYTQADTGGSCFQISFRITEE